MMELDIVKLTHDIKDSGLKKGYIGTVVYVYKNGEAFEVEFVDKDGNTIALLTLKPADIKK